MLGKLITQPVYALDPKYVQWAELLRVVLTQNAAPIARQFVSNRDSRES